MCLYFKKGNKYRFKAALSLENNLNRSERTLKELDGLDVTLETDSELCYLGTCITKTGYSWTVFPIECEEI